MMKVSWDVIMKVRNKIKTIRDYEKFLKSRGFSKTEALILSRAWKDIENRFGSVLVRPDNRS